MMQCEKALEWANTISTELAKQKWRYALLCQCSISGFSHFYEISGSAQDGKFRLCQCPVSGYSHFYFVGHVIDVDVSIGVNALSRAIPISTLPF